MNVVHLGVGRGRARRPEEGKHGLGDLDVAFAEGKLLHRRVAVRLGRQLLMAGAGRNLAFDGLSGHGAAVALGGRLGAGAACR